MILSLSGISTFCLGELKVKSNVFASVNFRNSSKSLFQKWKDITCLIFSIFSLKTQYRRWSKIQMLTSWIWWFWKLLRRISEGLEGRNWSDFGTLLLKTLVSFRTRGRATVKKMLRKKTICKEDSSSSHIKTHLSMQSALPLPGHKGSVVCGYPLYLP